MAMNKSDELKAILAKKEAEIKESRFRLIKIGTGINKKTGRPNFQVYLDRDTMCLEHHPWIGWCDYGDQSWFLNIKIIEAKNLDEAKKLAERGGEFDSKKFDIVELARDPDTSRHKYELNDLGKKLLKGGDMERAIELSAIVCQRI